MHLLDAMLELYSYSLWSPHSCFRSKTVPPLVCHLGASILLFVPQRAFTRVCMTTSLLTQHIPKSWCGAMQVDSCSISINFCITCL